MAKKTDNFTQLWRKKFLAKQETNQLLYKYDLNEVTMDIFVYIAAKKVNINSIVNEWYFRDVSFSTIKRSVNELKQKGLISTEQDSVDKRIKWLKANEEVWQKNT